MVGIAALIGAVLLWTADAPSLAEASAPATTTTTTRPTPTVTVPVAADLAPTDPLTTTIATAAFAQLEAHETIPDGETTHPRQQLSDATAWPVYSPEREGAPEIPSLKEGVQGRYRSEGGWVFTNPDPFGFNAVFVATELRGDWIHVLIPVRPNGTQGWVRASEVTLTTTRARVEVSISQRTLRVFDGENRLIEAPVVVGKSTSPTPTGRFYFTDSVDKRMGSVYGPGIIPISGFSQAMDHFSGGVPAIALHGTNRPDLLGSAASNGCIRMADATINLLRSTLPMGTPVDIAA